MRFTCSHCGQHIDAESDLAGKKATCPSCGIAMIIPSPKEAEAPLSDSRQAASEHKYWAFISYSSKDKSWGSWLHRAIETYGIPAEFVKHRKTSTGHPAPKRFHPVFRDRDELPASADLGAVIKEALCASRYLIVICSPHAAQSQWVNKEIETFLALGRRNHILAIIVDGEPNTGDARECFPPALRQFEPIAADARPEGDGKTNAKLKLLAGMLGVSFDSLRQRDRKRQRQRLTLAGISAGLLIVLLTTLISVAVRQSRLAEQRRQVAETATQRGDEASQKAKEEKGKGNRRLYVADMLKVQNTWEQGDMPHFLDLLKKHRPEHTGAEDLRGFEWYYWWRQSHRELLTFDGYGSFSFSPDGKRLAVSSRGKGKVWDVESGKEVLTLKLDKDRDEIVCVCFSPDGKRIATGSEEAVIGRGYFLRLWDAENGRGILTLNGKNPIHNFCFSPDSKRLVSIHEGYTMMVWDTESGKELFTIKGNIEIDENVCFSPDGKRLASVSMDKGEDYETVKVRDSTSGQILLTLNGRGSPLTSVCFSPDGKRLATGSGDKTVTMWDAVNGQELLSLMGRGRDICFSPDGQRLAASSDSMVMMWDVGSGKELLTLKGGGRNVCFSPDGKRLAASSDKMATVWNVEIPDETSILRGLTLGVPPPDLSPSFGEELLTLKGVSDVRFSPDSKRLAALSGRTPNQTVKLWDATGGPPTIKIFAVNSICFSPDSRRLATASKSNGVWVWNAATGQELVGLDPSRDVQSICFSPDGKHLATSKGYTVNILNAENGQAVRTLTVQKDSERARSVCFSPNGKRLASAGSDIIIWDVSTGQKLLTIESGGSEVCFSPDGSRLASVGHGGGVKLWNAETGQKLYEVGRQGDGWMKGIAFSPDGKRFASGGVDNTVNVWRNAETVQKLLSLKGHTEEITSVCFSSDGKRLVSGSKDGTVKVWDVESGLELLMFTTTDIVREIISVCFSPDGRQLAAASGQTIKVWSTASEQVTGEPEDVDSSIKIWDAVTGKRLITSGEHEAGVGTVCYSPDGTRFATCGNGVKVWDAEDGQELLLMQEAGSGNDDGVCFSPDGKRLAAGVKNGTLKVWDAKTGQELLTFKGHESRIMSVSFSPDGRRVASAGGKVFIWDVVSGKTLLTLKDGGNWVCFSPNGKRLASSRSGALKVWDATNGAELLSIKVGGDKVQFSPDSKRLATRCGTRIKVWDAENGKELLTIAAHKGAVESFCFSPDGKRLASGSSYPDHTLKVWDAESGKELLTIAAHTGPVNSVCFSPDGKRLISGGIRRMK